MQYGCVAQTIVAKGKRIARASHLLRELDDLCNAQVGQGCRHLGTFYQYGKGRVREITSTVGGKLRLLSPWPAIAVNGKPLQLDARGIVTMDTRPGERLIFADRK